MTRRGRAWRDKCPVSGLGLAGCACRVEGKELAAKEKEVSCQLGITLAPYGRTEATFYSLEGVWDELQPNTRGLGCGWGCVEATGMPEGHSAQSPLRVKDPRRLA